MGGTEDGGGGEDGNFSIGEAGFFTRSPSFPPLLPTSFHRLPSPTPHHPPNGLLAALIRLPRAGQLGALTRARAVVARSPSFPPLQSLTIVVIISITIVPSASSFRLPVGRSGGSHLGEARALIAKIVNLDRAEQRMLELRAALLNHAAAQYTNEVRMHRSMDTPVRDGCGNAVPFRANVCAIGRWDFVTTAAASRCVLVCGVSCFCMKGRLAVAKHERHVLRHTARARSLQVPTAPQRALSLRLTPTPLPPSDSPSLRSSRLAARFSAASVTAHQLHPHSAQA